MHNLRERIMYFKNTCFSFLSVIFISILALCLSGCKSGASTVHQTEQQLPVNAAESILAEQSDRHLRISLTVDEDPNSAKSTKFSSSELGGNFTEGLNCMDVRDVTIEVDGEILPFETALSQNIVNEEDIFYFARSDARRGICEEVYESVLGLAHFTYFYPEYTLRLIYDVYETPDGEQHLISDIGIYPPDFEPDTYTVFYNDGMLYYDFEDWGLDFNVKNATPTGVTFAVTQAAGQQIGQLKINSYFIGKKDGTPLDKLNGTREHEYTDIAISTNGTTEISIDWTDSFGSLTAGQYLLYLSVEDDYDKSSVHPLMKNYYDSQDYFVEFNIE